MTTTAIDPPADPVKALGYDEALRNITDQAGVLDAIRARAATLFSAAATVTSFLGGLALVAPAIAESGTFRGARIGDWAWAAIVAFGVVGLSTLITLLPWTFTFAMNPVQFVTDAQEAGLSVDELKGQLATFHWNHWESNQAKLDRLYWLLRIAVVAVFLEALFWIMEVRSQ